MKYDYDSSDWPLTSITISSPYVRNQYDGGSNLKTQMEDSSGTSSYNYDTHGHLESYAPPIPSGYSVEFDYNNASSKTVALVCSFGSKLTEGTNWGRIGRGCGN